jgi:REP element-mobilizing transposase RayT
VLEPPARHDRRRLRLARYDYRRSGAYFVTVCVHDRRERFGEIVNGQMRVTAAGDMVAAHWHALPNRFANVQLGTFIVMPDHVHGIVHLRRVAERATSHVSLSDVIAAFKSTSTVAYIDGVRRLGWPRFDRRLWQRSFYEHVIRDAVELAALRQYIVDNPMRRWLRL